MKSFKIFMVALSTLAMFIVSCKKEQTIRATNETTSSSQRIATNILYTMPDEFAPHESTWLQWPHQYTYGYNYKVRLEPTWVAMTKELVQVEKVHIIAYNNTEKNRIVTQLQKCGCFLNQC